MATDSLWYSTFDNVLEPIHIPRVLLAYALCMSARRNAFRLIRSAHLEPPGSGQPSESTPWGVFHTITSPLLELSHLSTRKIL
jgi:hypothetical protein